MTKETKATTKAKEVKEFEYDIDVLLYNCEAITGKKREVGEGALHGVDVEKMTKEEFKNKVTGFLKKKVEDKKKGVK